MDANQLLTSLGLTVGLPDLAFDGNGCARLLFDQRLAVDFEHDADTGSIHLYAVLGSSPAQGSGEALYRRLLEGNFFGVQTQGAVLSIDTARGEILLSRTVDVDAASSADFERVIEKFLAAAGHWQEALAGGAHDDVAPDSRAQEPRMPFMMKA